MAEISDDDMRAGLAQAREYTAMLLKAGERYGTEGSEQIVWEHGRRNFALRADGRLAVVNWGRGWGRGRGRGRSGG